MANTTVASANNVQRWSREFFKEFVRTERFRPYTGKNPNAVFQQVMDLQKESGDQITVSLVTKLGNAAVTGDNTLLGNEEAIGNYGHKLTVNQRRQAVSIGKHERRKSAMDILEAARPLLMDWAMEDLRDLKIAALLSPDLSNTAYASASEVQKDAWLAANSDRVLFGAAKSNNAANDHSAALLNVDATTDVLSPAIGQLAKRMAQTASPAIRPIKLRNPNREIFVMFCNSLAFRDLAGHTTMTQANRDARARGLMDHPIFMGGDLWHDGVLYVEIPEISVISGVGAAAIDVAPNFLCGAQAVGVAWAEQSHAISEETDYGNLIGRGIAHTVGVEKLFFNSVQQGVVTVYTAGVADV